MLWSQNANLGGIIFVVYCCFRQNNKHCRTRVSGTCVASSSLQELKFVSGRSPVSPHRGPYARTRWGHSRPNCKRSQTTRACQSSDSPASVNMRPGRTKLSPCFVISSQLLRLCSLSVWCCQEKHLFMVKTKI